MTAPASAPAPIAPPTRAIRVAVIHCSASANGKPLTVQELDRWHKLRGFRRDPKLIGFNAPELKHIGYHFVIDVDGNVTSCRGEREMGAHVQGYNQDSLGICLVGTDAFTAAQWRALRNLVTGLQVRHRGIKVKGHRDFSPDQNANGIIEPFEWLKTCPGFDVAGWLADKMQPPAGHVWGVAP